MRNVKKLVVSALIGIFTLTAAGCGMIEKTEEGIRRQTVAKVGKIKLTKSELDDRMTSLLAALKEQYGENYTRDEGAKEQYLYYANSELQSLVDEEVLRQKADELKLVPGEAELEKEANDKIKESIEKNYANDEKKFEEAFAQNGIKKEDTLEYYKRQVILSKVYEYITKDAEVTDTEISEYYESNKATYYTKKPGADIYHIVATLKDEEGNEKRTEAEAEARIKEVITRLEKGEKFEDLAKEYGEDGTKDQGGSLGYIEYDNQNYDKDFMAAAKLLKEGEISGAVKSSFGYHVIKVQNIQTETKVTPLEEVKDDIKETLEYQKKSSLYTSKMEEWKKELDVKTYDKNLE